MSTYTFRGADLYLSLLFLAMAAIEIFLVVVHLLNLTVFGLGGLRHAISSEQRALPVHLDCVVQPVARGCADGRCMWEVKLKSNIWRVAHATIPKREMDVGLCGDELAALSRRRPSDSCRLQPLSRLYAISAPRWAVLAVCMRSLTIIEKGTATAASAPHVPDRSYLRSGSRRRPDSEAQEMRLKVGAFVVTNDIDSPPSPLHHFLSTWHPAAFH